MTTLPDALASALGLVVAEQKREARKEIDRIETDGRAIIAELRADIVSHKAQLSEAYSQALDEITERLFTLKDGVDGEPGKDGPPGDPGSLLLPPELVEQVASAVRLLHESPPIQHSRDNNVRASRVTRIERDDDGNLVPVYEPQS